SGQEGFDLMERIRALDPSLPVLVMTGFSSVAGAVEAMRRGARDYIEKPWDDDKLLAAVRTQIELRRAVRRNQRLQEANARLQRKLLRVLQAGEMARVGSSRVRYVNVRVISATNADLHAEISAGRFREDLLYRLNTVVIHLPPLRDRRSDVDALARHFLGIYAARYRKPIAGFDADAAVAMQAHDWPGNVRELAHSIERAVLMADPAATT